MYALARRGMYSLWGLVPELCSVLAALASKKPAACLMRFDAVIRTSADEVQTSIRRWFFSVVW
jgi:hypothetical protein